jgi:hypothetical protein
VYSGVACLNLMQLGNTQISQLRSVGPAGSKSAGRRSPQV